MKEIMHPFSAKLKFSFHSFAICLLLTFLAGCGGDASPSAKEITTNILTAHNWKLSSITVDGTDQTSLFSNMTLNFTATTFTVSNGGLVWPSSGTWAFKDETAKVIVRNDGVEITLTEAKETSLIMSLTWTKSTFGPGRISSIAGVHIFKMIKP